jgi:hypothetical protein
MLRVRLPFTVARHIRTSKLSSLAVNVGAGEFVAVVVKDGSYPVLVLTALMLEPHDPPFLI